MGCIFSTEAVDDGGIYEALVPSGEVYVFVPGFRVPHPIDFTELLKGSVSPGLAAKLQSLRSHIIAASASIIESRRIKKIQDGDHSRVDLEKALKDYLPLLLGLVNGGEKLTSAIEYPWTNVEDEKKDAALASGYYELLSVLQLLGMMALQEANICLTPRPASEDGYNRKAAEEEKKRAAIEILLKAASYFECAINSVLPNTPDEIKVKLPADLSENMLRSMEQQALGQAVELQLGFAIDNVKASLAVKRRLACEQKQLWEQAMEKLTSVSSEATLRDKHVLFVKWKLAEAKATAYYFHGLILDEGYEANSHAQSLSCLKAAHAHLRESQKARTEFSNTEPFTKIPPVWGPMKYLGERIPREALGRARIFRDNYSNEKFPETTPKLPEFAIALEADAFRLPPVDSAWKKEKGFEARPSSLTPEVPSFLAKNKEQNRSVKSDLRKAEPLVPPNILSEMVVEA